MRNHLILAIFTLLLFSFAAHGLAQDVNYYMEKGQVAYQDGKFEEAIRYFDRVVRADSDYPGVYEYRGNALFILQDYARAESDFSRAIEKYYRKEGKTTSGAYIQGNIVLLEPDQSGISNSTYAMLYNNRGASRFFLGKTRDALADFDEAVALDKSLDAARQNRRNVESGAADKDNGSITGYTDSRTPGSRYNRRDYRYDRPISVPKAKNPANNKEISLDVRESRVEIVDEGKSRGGIMDIFKPKPFVKRTVSKRGKEYKNPPVTASSHNYITIESVKITQRETVVNFKVINNESKPYQVALEASNSSGTYYITDRSGSTNSRIKMRSVAGIATYPKTTELQPRVPVYFSVTFPKIPDHMGYINIIEGDKEDGSEWNFYQVDLTK